MPTGTPLFPPADSCDVSAVSPSIGESLRSTVSCRSAWPAAEVHKPSQILRAQTSPASDPARKYPEPGHAVTGFQAASRKPSDGQTSLAFATFRPRLRPFFVRRACADLPELRKLATRTKVIAMWDTALVASSR